MAEALAFPSSAPPAWLETPGLSQSGLSLRAASESDLPFLRDLYAESRAAELAPVPWPGPVKRAFCDSQFALQHRHYVAHCVPAAFLVALLEGRPVGRLYLHWTPDGLHIVDILLDAVARGRGIGSALLHWTQTAALGAGIGTLSLYVERHNDGAYRLYRRLGFHEEKGDHDGHRHMVWRRSPSTGTAVS